MTLPQTILEAVDRFGDLCTKNPQTGVKLAERDRLLAVIKQHAGAGQDEADCGTRPMPATLWFCRKADGRVKYTTSSRRAQGWSADPEKTVVAYHAESESSPAAKAEWATLDPRWLVQYLRQKTNFDAEAVSEMIAFAQAAAEQASTSTAHKETA